MEMEPMISVGPWGLPRDMSYNHRGDGIKKIAINHEGGIDAIQVLYARKGKDVWSDKMGGNGGRNKDVVDIEYPNEFLTSVEGYCGHFSKGSKFIITSLTFFTNRSKYGPFGPTTGTAFYVPMYGGEIVGLHGKHGEYIFTIGFHVKPRFTPAASLPCCCPCKTAVVCSPVECPPPSEKKSEETV